MPQELVTIKTSSLNTLIYKLTFGPHITHFTAAVAMKQKNFDQNFHSSELSVLATDDNKEVTSQIP